MNIIVVENLWTYHWY